MSLVNICATYESFVSKVLLRDWYKTSVVCLRILRLAKSFYTHSVVLIGRLISRVPEYNAKFMSNYLEDFV